MSRSTSTRAPQWWHRVCLFVAGVLAALVTVTGCGAGTSPRGELGENRHILASCDPAAPPASLVEIDGTGSSASDTVTAERMTAIESIVRRTAICSGYLRVIMFSASSAAAIALFDGPLRLDGATVNARLKRVPGAVSDAMATIRQAYGPAVTALPGGGSDITAQYRLAAEWIGQIGDPYRLHLYVLTDGFQTIGIDLGARALSEQEVAALADLGTMPQLPGASVVVAGLGRVAGEPPPSNVVEGLVAYYDALCHKTGAAQCVSVTAYAPEGR